jgi:hypothetical protein
MNAIERMIDFMIENKIYSKVLKLKDQNKVILFIYDADHYIENKQIRVKKNRHTKQKYYNQPIKNLTKVGSKKF